MEAKKEITETLIIGKHRRYAFTWNNYTKEEVETLKALDATKVDYLIFGFEIGEETKTPHLQGYVEFSTPLALSTAKSRLDPIKKKASGVCLLLPKKCAAANINYCKKEETIDKEAATIYNEGKKYIEVIHKEKRQGERTDWHIKYEFLENNPSFVDFAKEYPEHAFKYHAGIDRIIHALKEKKQREGFVEKYSGAKLQQWQQNLVDELQKPANDRKIIWIWDTVGKKGKTWISNYLVAMHEGVRFSNASCKDIAHAYNGERIISFDFTRTTVERVNYQIIEELKGGSIFSPKYNSSFKYFATPHIICFANCEPNKHAVSLDRWDIRCLDNLEAPEAPEGKIQPCNINPGGLTKAVKSSEDIERMYVADSTQTQRSSEDIKRLYVADSMQTQRSSENIENNIEDIEMDMEEFYRELEVGIV